MGGFLVVVFVLVSGGEESKLLVLRVRLRFDKFLIFKIKGKCSASSLKTYAKHYKNEREKGWMDVWGLRAYRTLGLFKATAVS